MNAILQDVLKRAESWPEDAQKELAEIALEIESGLGDTYHATADELKAIDEADASGVATPEEVEAAFGAFRRK